MTQALFASIIVPAFNAAATIEQTVDRLLRQTWTYMEVIVVDCGSTDDTVGRVREMIGTRGDPRLRILQQAGPDLAAARAAGIAAAHGHYVACCNPGDVWAPATLEMHMADDLMRPEARTEIAGVRMLNVTARPCRKAAAMVAGARRPRRSAGAGWLAAVFGGRDFVVAAA